MGRIFKNKWLLLGLMALTWGSSFILIKKALTVFTPYQIGAFRVSLSGILLVGIGIPALRRLTRREVLWIGITGFFGNFAPLFLFPIAQTRVSSSLAGIINALEPIFVLVLGFLLFNLKSSLSQRIGAAIGFLGAAILVYSSNAGHGENYFFFTLLMILGSLFYALSSLLIKSRLQHIKTLDITAGVYTIWMIPSVVLLYYTGFITELKAPSRETFEALGILTFLTLISTTLAMALFYKLIQETSAVFASSVSFLIPIVAIAWGLLDGEKFIVWYAVGGILILIGIYLIRERRINSSPISEKKSSPTKERIF